MERFNRTLADRLFTYQYHKELEDPSKSNREWVSRLQNVVSSLNNEKTRLIGMKSVNAIKQTLVEQGFSQPVKEYEEKLLDVGTKVRYLYEPGELEGYQYKLQDGTNILYPYEIPLTIPILECILKRNKLSTYKDSIYFIYFKLSGGSFPHITTKEYNTILNTFNVVSSVYDKYKPNDRKSFLNYSFVLKKLLIMLGKVEYAKCIQQLKTHSKQKELERV